MRLTDTHRKAYVSAALGDVPSIDYPTLIADDAERRSFANLPADLQKVFKDKARRSFLDRKVCYEIGGSAVAYSAGPLEDSDREALRQMYRDSRDQDRVRGDLRIKLESVARGCTTTKQLAEALPGFAKYLPKEAPPANRSVPVVSGVVEAFTAAGWPK